MCFSGVVIVDIRTGDIKNSRGGCFDVHHSAACFDLNSVL